MRVIGVGMIGVAAFLVVLARPHHGKVFTDYLVTTGNGPTS